MRVCVCVCRGIGYLVGQSSSFANCSHRASGERLTVMLVNEQSCMRWMRHYISHVGTMTDWHQVCDQNTFLFERRQLKLLLVLGSD